MRFTAAARSGAVSASVPSRSNSTASVTHATQQIVHIAARLEPVDARNRVVRHPDQLLRAQAARAAPARELGRLDEARVVVRAFGQQLEHVLRAYYGEQVG